MDNQQMPPPMQPGGSYSYKPPKKSSQKGKINPWVVVAAFLLIAVISGWWFFKYDNEKRKGTPIEITNTEDNTTALKDYPIANTGEVSPISGLACENWNRRPIAVMQPADIPARPPAGFSEADMVIEMPVITASITRLMALYICNDPPEVGSMRSSRHDFIHLAKGFDAIYVHWGGSHFAKEILNQGVIDNMNCNNDGGKSAGQCCFRKEGMSRGVDSGYAKFPKLLECAKEFEYSMENTFSGYPHQQDAPMNQRINKGHLRIGFAGKFAVEYDYDKESNSYLRSWGGNPDIDRNNQKRIAPRNVVVLMARSEQIEGQYNNVQLGDPWYDESDSGEAFYYINGQEIRGKWKKDKTNINSKLMFMDQNGNDVAFVPGQIWVEILEPGQALKWKTEADIK
ncbi:MAG: DUF3048 domain-containing protein [Patescibacteria group bacterium]|nr:DUF3048 domain-containing protein [Patescibacteria group bacterium]